MPWKYLRMTRRCTRDRPAVIRIGNTQMRRLISAAAKFLQQSGSGYPEPLFSGFYIPDLGMLAEKGKIVLNEGDRQ